MLAATARAARCRPTARSISTDIGAIDSSAVAVLLALKRRADEEGKPLRFAHVPAALAALAEVYGVEAILGA